MRHYEGLNVRKELCEEWTLTVKYTNYRYIEYIFSKIQQTKMSMNIYLILCSNRILTSKMLEPYEFELFPAVDIIFKMVDFRLGASNLWCIACAYRIKASEELYIQYAKKLVKVILNVLDRSH